MTDGVQIDEGAVDAVVVAVQARATTWGEQADGLTIDGVGDGVDDLVAGSVATWRAELDTASEAMGLAGDRVRTDADAFLALDAGMAAPTGLAGPNAPRPV